MDMSRLNKTVIIASKKGVRTRLVPNISQSLFCNFQSGILWNVKLISMDVKKAQVTI